MFSVVLPTMWKISEFLKDLNDLENCDKVGEIILINNNISATPSEFDVTNYTKIIEIKPPRNMYVNPAWNFGVRTAKFDKILIKNDDIFFNYNKCLTAVEEELNKDDCIIGTYISANVNKTGVETHNVINHDDDKIRFDIVSERGWGYGCAMFFNKKTYIPINENLLIWCGDDFMTQTYSRRGLNIKTIRGVNMNGYVSATVDHIDEIINLKYQDDKIWNHSGDRERFFKECGL